MSDAAGSLARLGVVLLFGLQLVVLEVLQVVSKAGALGESAATEMALVVLGARMHHLMSLKLPMRVSRVGRAVV